LDVRLADMQPLLEWLGSLVRTSKGTQSKASLFGAWYDWNPDAK
jgi:hypothetical protein